jgi:hypothetical protein
MRLRPNSRRNLLAAASFDYGAEKHAPLLSEAEGSGCLAQAKIM